MPCDMRQQTIQKLVVLNSYSSYSCMACLSYQLLATVSILFSPLYRLSSVLGSGQFGVVYRGALVNGEGEEVEVAVKTLKEGSGKEEKVKFLQEAAIMGQFKHHNVVTMYGVVTQGEPVSFATYGFSCG